MGLVEYKELHRVAVVVTAVAAAAAAAAEAEFVEV